MAVKDGYFRPKQADRGAPHHGAEMQRRTVDGDPQRGACNKIDKLCKVGTAAEIDDQVRVRQTATNIGGDR